MNRFLKFCAISLLLPIGFSSCASFFASATPGERDIAQVARPMPAVGYGWEPTFTNEEILSVDVDLRNAQGETYHWKVEVPENAKYRDLMKDKISKLCANQRCAISQTRNKHGALGWKITYPDGKFFAITPDPSVVEIIVGSLTLKQYREARQIFENDMFGSARAVGLKPHIIEGQGHISIFSAAFEDPVFFRNFLVDMSNHPELGLGIFEYNPLDAPPVGLNEAKANSFQQVIDRFDRGELRTVKELASAIESDVYAAHLDDPLRSARHEQALRLYALFGSEKASRRLEVRTFRPQANFDEFLLQVELIEARMKRLYNFDGVIPYNQMYQPTIRQAEQNFKKMVEEAGLDWKRYKHFIPAEWKKAKDKNASCTSVLRVFTQKDLIFR